MECTFTVQNNGCCLKWKKMKTDRQRERESAGDFLILSLLFVTRIKWHKWYVKDPKFMC